MLQSFMLILVSLVFAAVGQYFLKMGAGQLGVIGAEATGRALQIAWAAATNPWLIVGLGCYAMGAVTWIIVLSRAQLSWAYPMLALNQVLVLMVGAIFFHEHVSMLRWGGVLLIVTGVFMVSRS